MKQSEHNLGDGPERKGIELGILDVVFLVPGRSAVYPFGASVATAQAAEDLGYSRFWVAEHHGTASAHRAPEILVAAIAGATSKIKVGTGGLLLRYRNPYQTAQTFSLLAALYPSRIELGIARGFVPGHLRKYAAPGLRPGAAEARVLDRKVKQLLGLLREGSRTGLVVPAVPALAVWMLGTNSGVQIAADSGLHCTIDLIYNTVEPEVLQSITAAFQARASTRQELALGVCGICAATDFQAKAYLDAMARRVAGYRPIVVGCPERCRDQIAEMEATYGVNKFIFLDLHVFDALEDRRRSYKLLARACGI